MNTSFFEAGGCKDQEEACYAAGTDLDSDKICKKADNFCVSRLFTPYEIIMSYLRWQIDNLFVPAVGDRDSDDLRQNSSALFPPENYKKFLHRKKIMKKIGAESRYKECPDPPFELFTTTGDVRSFSPLRENMLLNPVVSRTQGHCSHS